MDTTRDTSLPNAISTCCSLGANEINIATLKQQLVTPLGVVPFVGAGMSAAFGFPTWRSFLESHAQSATRQHIMRLLDSGQYEESAQELQDLCGANAFQEDVDHTFGRPITPGPLPAAAVLRLPRLCSGPVLTTNFDHVLEEVFKRAKRPFEDIIVGVKADALRMAVQHNRNVLVKLHGDAHDRSDRVFTASDYKRAYGKREPLRAFLQYVMPRTLLFLGCSLGNDRTVRVLRALATHFRKMNGEAFLLHYAILERASDERDAAARERQLEELGIRPVWYPAGQHHLIADLLDSLAPKPDIIECLGIRFVAIPPGQGATFAVRRGFFVSETLVSEEDWNRILGPKETPVGAPLLAKTSISISQVTKFLHAANAKIVTQRLALPTVEQWDAIVGAGTTPAPQHLDAPRLRTARPSCVGVHDLLGVAWQFCTCRVGYELRGGSFATPFQDPLQEPLPVTGLSTTTSGSEYGFRVVLLTD